MNRKFCLIICNATVITLLLALSITGVFSSLPQAVADDGGNKISSEIYKAVGGATGRDSLYAMRALQGMEADPGSIMVFIYMHHQPTATQLAELSALGVTAYPNSWIPPVGAHPLGFFTALVPGGKIYSLAAKQYVVRLDYAEKQSQRSNDAAATAMSAGTAWTGGFTGSGVRVAVLDDGLDVTHPDFSTPVFAKDYWAYPAVSDNVVHPLAGGSAHGTHVAGSVLGRGTQSGGTYRGMAYGAELVFIKIANNITGSASSAAMIGALKDAVEMYKANVISMSFGGWSSHHDGSDANCQGADYAASKGAIVVLCAGNSADDAKHYRGTVSAGSSTGFIQVNATGSDGANCTLEHNLVWYDGLGVRNELMLQYYDAGQNTISTTYWAQQESSRGTERRQFSYGDPGIKLPAGNSTYYIRVFNNSNNDQPFHIYYDGASVSQVAFKTPDSFYTVESPGDSDSSICVGAYTSRESWTDYTGNLQNFGETLGQVASFSSRGPRVDTNRLVKPTIVAPGSAIISCRDRSKPLNIFTVSNKTTGGLPADYYVMQGTSMATPVTSGATALLLQAHTFLRGKQAAVRTLWQQAGSKASTPDFTWGYGLIDIQRAINLAAGMKSRMVNVQGNQVVKLDTGGGIITTAQGTGINEMHSQSVVGLPAVFPYGLFDFDIDDLTPGGYVDITITLPQAGPTEYWHFTRRGWVQMPVISVNGNIMVVRFTDGGAGDDDNAADGDIDGFGGPALDDYYSDERSHNSALGGSATTTQPISLPSISVQSASLAETRAGIGQQVEVKALVSNQGRVKGDAALRIYVNGVQEDTLGVAVAAGQTTAVSYQFSRKEPGTYAVNVNNIPAGVVVVEDPTGNSVMVLSVFTVFVIAIAAVLFVLVRRFRIAG